MNVKIAKLQRNDQALDGWNIYVKRPFKKIHIYPDAETIYFEVCKKDEKLPSEVEVLIRYRQEPKRGHKK